MEEHEKDITDEAKELMKQRAVIIQAQLVKIMKGRRTCKHNDLIFEAIRLISSFKPDPPMIKQQIEWLIESDYLMRDEKDVYFCWDDIKINRGTYIYKP